MIHWNQLWTWKMKWNTKAIQNWMHSERVKSSYKCDNFICIFFPPFAVQKRNSLGCEIQFRRIKTDSMQRFIQFSYTCGLVRSMPRQAYIHLPFVHSTVLIRCVLFHGTFIEIMTLSLNHRLNVQLKSIRYTQKKQKKHTHHSGINASVYTIYNVNAFTIHKCVDSLVSFQFHGLRLCVLFWCYCYSMSQRIQLCSYSHSHSPIVNSCSIELDCSDEFSRVLHLSLFDHFTFP